MLFRRCSVVVLVDLCWLVEEGVRGGSLDELMVKNELGDWNKPLDKT